MKPKKKPGKRLEFNHFTDKFEVSILVGDVFEPKSFFYPPGEKFEYEDGRTVIYGDLPPNIIEIIDEKIQDLEEFKREITISLKTNAIRLYEGAFNKFKDEILQGKYVNARDWFLNELVQSENERILSRDQKLILKRAQSKYPNERTKFEKDIISTVKEKFTDAMKYRRKKFKR